MWLMDDQRSLTPDDRAIRILATRKPIATNSQHALTVPIIVNANDKPDRHDVRLAGCYWQTKRISPTRIGARGPLPN